jgi:hypothetical protein
MAPTRRPEGAPPPDYGKDDEIPQKSVAFWWFRCMNRRKRSILVCNLGGCLCLGLGFWAWLRFW